MALYLDPWKQDGLIADASLLASADADQLHIWRICLNQPQSVTDRLVDFLSSDERQRANQFMLPILGKRYTVAHAALRSILGLCCELEARDLSFAYGPQGKPHLSPATRSKIEFSLSRSDNMALVAVAQGRSVGVDIQSIQRDLDWLGVAQTVFSEAEIELLESLPEEELRARFYAIWTRKEAVLKAIGCGMLNGTSRVTATHSWPPVDGFFALSHGFSDGQWFLADVASTSCMVAAVCVERGFSAIHYYDWLPSLCRE